MTDKADETSCIFGALNREKILQLEQDSQKIQTILEKVRDRPPAIVTIIIGLMSAAIGFLVKGILS